MNTAIILNGNIRTVEQTYSNILETFSFLNPDYFISTYNNRYGYHPAIQNFLNYYDDPLLTEKEIVDVYSYFKPKSMIIDNIENMNQYYEKESKQFNNNMKDHPSSYMQYFKINLGLKLIEEYEDIMKYDIIIKTRFDIWHNDIQNINFENINKKVIVSTGNVFPNDVVIITERNNFFNIIKFMLNEFYQFTDINSNLNPPHGLLLSACQRFNLEIEQFSIMNHVIRVNQKQYY